MWMGTLKHWCIGKYTNHWHCHLLQKVPVDEEVEQRQRSIMEEYKQKLIVCGNVMTDPFSLHDGWLAEKKEQVWQNGHQFII